MSGNINYSDLERFFARIQEMSNNRDFNLSEYDNAIKSAMEEFESYVVKAADNVKSQNELIQQSNDAADRYLDGLLKAGDPDALNKASKFQSDYFNKLEEENKKNIEKLKKINSEHQKGIDEIEEKKYKHAKSQVYNTLSNGRSSRVEYRGEKFNNLSEAFQTFGDKKGGVLGKGLSSIGGGLGKVGGLLTRFAGPIGIATQAISALTGAIGDGLKTLAEQKELDTEKISNRNQEKLSLLNISGQLAQSKLTRDIAYANAEQSNALSLASEGKNITNSAEAIAHQVATQSIFDIKGGAFAAAEAAINSATDIMKFGQHSKYGEQLVAQQKLMADSSFQMAQLNADAEANMVRVSAATKDASLNLQQDQKLWNATAGKLLNVVDSSTGRMFNVSGITEGVQSNQTADLNRENMLKNFNAEYGKALTSINANLQNSAIQANAQLQQNLINFNKTLNDQAIESAKQIKMAYLKMTETEFDAFQKAETAVYKMGRGMDLSGDKLAAYAKSLSHTQTIVGKWGKTMEDIEKLQLSFQETTGRNRELSDSDFDKSFAMGKLIGDDVVTQLDAGVEIFNMGISDANDKMYEMYKQASKMGLNGKKLAKDIVSNLKLAEKYNFKQGVQGLMNMAKWAQNMRFNTASLDGMLDKVQEGGLEGVIKQAAELQVLGGNFAMGSDPLAMAYESYMDPEAYAKRMNGMLAGQGYLKEDGSVGFGITSQQLMRQYAKSTGQDYKDVLNQARQQYKINAIQSSLNPSQKFNEDQQAMIANKAEYKDGQWRVKVGKDENNNDIFKNVNEITSQDVAEMGSDNSEKTIEEAVQGMLSTQERMEGVQNTIQARLMENEWTTLRETALQLIENVQTNFIDNYQTYHTELRDGLDTIKNTQGSFLDQFQKSVNDPNSIYKTLVPAITQLSTHLSSALTTVHSTTNDYIARAQKAIVAAINGEDVENMLSDPNIEEFKKNKSNKVWLQKSTVEGTHEFEVMKNLYSNFGNAFDKLNDIEKIMLSYWDPTGNKTSAVLSKEQKEYVNNLKPLGKFYSQMATYLNGDRKFGEGTTTYTDGQKYNSHNLKKKTTYVETGNPQYDATMNNASGGVSTYIDMKDGFITKNGNISRIDDQDQVLAAKNGGPIDKMLDTFQSSSNVMPRPMPYNSFVSSSVGGMSGGMGGNNSINIPPIQININGSIQLNGSGSVDITQQLSNDPNFIRSISQIISVEVEKKVNGGKTINTLNRNLSW